MSIKDKVWLFGEKIQTNKYRQGD